MANFDARLYGSSRNLDEIAQGRRDDVRHQFGVQQVVEVAQELDGRGKDRHSPHLLRILAYEPMENVDPVTGPYRLAKKV